MKTRLLAFFLLLIASPAFSQMHDTLVVQTLTYDSLSRAGVFHFPDTGTFEKVLLQYSMRCHHALVSNSSNTEQGCGQWDYNCETYITDSSRTDSVKSTTPDYTISNWPGGNFPFTRTPTSTIRKHSEYRVSYSTTPNWKTAQAGSGSEETLTPMSDGARIFYLFRASKLTQLKPGAIQGLSFSVHSPGGPFKDVRIRLHTTKDTAVSLALLSDTNYTNVFYSDTSLVGNTLLFYQPFVWDGTSNIIIELAASENPKFSSTSPIIYSGSTNYASRLLATGTENVLNFSGAEYIPMPSDAITDPSTAITLSVWAYGDPLQLPGANTVLTEGIDQHGNRQVNVHLPWSDGNVYWDCGGDASGFDRISKAANKIQSAGRWNHWAFTKNAITGSMKIYLNGKLWASDTGKHRHINIKQMFVGRGITSTIGYLGQLSHFTMWDRELDSNAIRSLMADDTLASDSLNRFLDVALPLDEGTGTLLQEVHGLPSVGVSGQPVWRKAAGIDLFRGFDTLSTLPQMTFFQTTDTIKPTIATTYTYDTLVNPPNKVTHYTVVGGDQIVAIDSSYLYQATKRYTYDDQGKKVDSANVAAVDTIRISQLHYYQKWPQKYELMSFVTPYGIGLDLGKTGKMWEFDVTDYLPVMKGWKRLSMERGSGQEEFDLRFLFIKGTPARNVLDMQQVWPMTEEGYQTIQSDARYEPREVWMNSAAKGYKLRSYITGHGQQGEFVPQTHYISINGKKYERLVLKECSSDPLYPQGGTWTYNRAGWCPGMATDLAEYEITGTVKPGDSALIDYGVEGGSGDSRYDPSTQLVSYGAPNFTLNASIVRTLRPSERIEFARINPACDLPIVMIKNNGSQTLTSLTFEYYVDGGPHRIFNWTGSLKFLDTASVILPVDSLGFWTSALTGNFHVDISNPNGASDEYDADNHYTSVYTQPPQYSGIVVVNLTTNKNPEQNRYEIIDMKGNTVFSNDNFDATTTYYDSLSLPTGCYTMIFHDDGEDGLSYWANPDQGNGVLRFRQTSRTGKILKTFGGDFGKFIQYDFSIVQPASSGVTSTKSPYTRVSLYPNPATELLRVNLDGYASQMVTFEIVNEAGTVIRREAHATGSIGSLNTSIDVRSLPAGSYFLRVTTNEGAVVHPFNKE